jgi:hypothetical protein
LFTQLHRIVAAAALAVVAFAASAANEPALHWAAASRGVIPKGSLVVGKDATGKPLYACRARLANGADVPGMIREPLIGCSVVYGGLQWSIASYQVLRDDGPKVIAWASGAAVAPRAHRVGRERDGAALFLCRARQPDGLRIGKLGASGACVYGAGGKEEQAAEFEVLVRP